MNLDKGSVIFGLGGNDGDCGNYRGMVVSVPEHGGSPSYWIYQPAPPATSGGAVWGASGPAVDAEGHIYAATGNPNPGSQKAETYDYSDSVIELQATLSQSGYFKPESWLVDSNNDRDLGSAGPELLPGGVLFQSGKNDIGYLIDEATMASGAPPLYSHQVCSGAGSFGGDAFANGTIYVPCADGTRALSYNQSVHSFSELWRGPTPANGSPILSAGLVWVPSTKFGGGAGTTLYGLELATGTARYTLTLPSGVQDHFASPSAAAGRLLLATGESVSAYRIAEVPHWYKNGARVAEASKLRLLAWGTLTLSNASTGLVKCKTVAGLETENSPGGGAGTGTLPGAVAYSCVAPSCESAGGTAELVPEKLPWTSVLVEEAQLFNDKLEGITLRVICAANKQSVQFSGSLKPEFVNGFLIGAAPSTLQFGTGSGSLQSTAGAGEVTGKWKLMGYEGQELAQVKDP